LAGSAGVPQLQGLVMRCDERIPRDYRAAADFQAARVERNPGNARLGDYLGMLLASDFISADDLGGSSPTYSSASAGGHGSGDDSSSGDSGSGGGDW
jgi:hypothetical protein